MLLGIFILSRRGHEIAGEIRSSVTTDIPLAWASSIGGSPPILCVYGERFNRHNHSQK